MTFPPLSAAVLDDAFALRECSYIYLIGAGGKTTLMFALAHHLAARGHTVLSTTSTKILVPTEQQTVCILVDDDIQRVAARLRVELPPARHITLGKARCDAGRKLKGFTAEELDRIRQAFVATYILVEADGAAGRSLKAHDDHEPVISSRADLVVAVIGADCIGRPLNDECVHRAERFGQLLNRPQDGIVTVDDVAAIVFHPLGYLKAVPQTARFHIWISKVSDAARRSNAHKLAHALRAADPGRRVARIVMGELAGPAPFLERID